MRIRSLFIAFLCLTISSAAIAQRDTKLKPGDETPKFDLVWYGGEQLSIDKGDVFLIFIAKSLNDSGRTLLSFVGAMQNTLSKHDVRVAVITQDKETDVQNFMARYQAEARFAVGLDRRSQTTSSWAGAAKLSEKLSMFIVGRDSRLMYMKSIDTNDNPKKADEILRRVIRERFDPKLEPVAEQHMEQASRHRRVKDFRMTEIHYDKVIALDKRVFADIALEKFEMYLVDMNEPDRAYTYATSLIDEEYASDAQLLIDLAEKIATDPDIPDEKRRFDVAVKSAKAAIETIRSENKYKALSALAKVHYASGELQEAVNLQREAWFLAEPRHKSEFKHDLDSYDSALRRAQSTSR